MEKPNNTLAKPTLHSSFASVLNHSFTGWVVLGLSLLLTISAFFIAKSQVDERALERFVFKSEEISAAIEERVGLYEQALHGGVGLFNASKHVDRGEFKQYVDALQIYDRLPGFQGIGYSIPLKPSELPQHVRQIREEGFEYYDVKPAGDRDFYTSIVYLEPFDWRNQRAFGYDMWSNAMRREAMLRAMDEGLASTSGLITLVQETDEDVQRGFLTYVPVYKKNQPVNTVEARRANIQGWVYAAFRIKDFMQGIRAAEDSKLTFFIYDGTEKTTESLLFQSVEVSQEEFTKSTSSEMFFTDQFRLQGRTWTVDYHALKSDMLQAGEKNDPIFVLVAGLVVNALLFYVLLTLRHLNRETQKSTTEIQTKYQVSLEKLLQKEVSIDSARQQASLYFDLAPVAFIVVNKYGKIVNINERASELFGYQKEELISQPVEVLIPEDLSEKHVGYRNKFMRAPANREMMAGSSLKGRKKDGSTFPTHVNLVTTVTDGEVNIIASVRDVSEQTEFEKALKDAKINAEKSSKAKGDFVANMSHEIRTPLNAVLGSAQLLAKTKLNDVQNNYIGIIRGAGEALLGIINDILDFSKIESGNLELAPVEFEIDEILSRVAMMMSVSAADKNLQLAVVVDKEIPRKLVGDALRIQQVLINLCANAIKFTNLGEVVLEIRSVAIWPSSIKLHFAVRDTGIGMSNDQQKNLFKAFSQADTSITRQFGGTGLGLTISNKIVNLMGGEIEVKSHTGEGSEFSFETELPFAGDEKRAKAPIDKNYHVVVVEKNATARQAITAIFERWDWPCKVFEDVNSLASSADNALAECNLFMFNEEFCERFCDETFDIIKRCNLPEDCLVLVVRAHGSGGTTTMASKVFKKVGQIHSPVVASSILNELLVLEGYNRKTVKEGGVDFSKVSLSGLRFLLVEDNTLNQQIAQDFLSESQVSLDIANNGSEALDIVRSATSPYDIIFMDIQMPVMDGVTATKRLRSPEFDVTAPIIAMTAGVLSSEQQEYLDAGMSDFIPKPIEHDVFFSTIGRYLPVSFIANLEKNKTSDDGNNSSSLDENQVSLREIGLVKPNEKATIFDATRIESLARGKPERVKRIAESLSKLADTALQEYDDGCAKFKAGDKEGALFIFHSLKGVIGNYGGKDASEGLQLLEAKIKDSIPYEEALGYIDTTRTSISVYLNAVQTWANQNATGIAS